jgi:hypothetical protein
VPASKHVQHSFTRRSVNSPREARACRPVICEMQRWGSPAEKRLLGQPLLVKETIAAYRAGPSAVGPSRTRRLPGLSPVVVSAFAHEALDGVHKRTRAARYSQSCVRLCTRHKAACARTDRSGAILPVPCPTLHTRGRPVCTNGHVPSPFAARASACAHGHPGRARMRASRRRDRHPRA